MHAVVRETSYPEGVRLDRTAEFEEFQREHAALSGYVGTVVVDAGAGRFVTVTLWRTEEDVNAAREAMLPVAERTVAPLMASPAKLVGSGPVIVNDVT